MRSGSLVGKEAADVPMELNASTTVLKTAVAEKFPNLVTSTKYMISPFLSWIKLLTLVVN